MVPQGEACCQGRGRPVTFGDATDSGSLPRTVSDGGITEAVGEADPCRATGTLACQAGSSQGCCRCTRGHDDHPGAITEGDGFTGHLRRAGDAGQQLRCASRGDGGGGASACCEAAQGGAAHRGQDRRSHRDRQDPHRSARRRDQGLPFLKVDAAGMATFADWVGAVSLTEGSQGVVTAFAPSILLEGSVPEPTAPTGAVPGWSSWMRSTGCLRLRLECPHADDRRVGRWCTSPMPTDPSPIDPAVMWVLTANIGSQYSGTLPIDPAILNRVTTHIEVAYPSAKAEADMIVEQGRCDRTVAEQLVRVAAQVRKASASGSIAAPGCLTRQFRPEPGRPVPSGPRSTQRARPPSSGAIAPTVVPPTRSRLRCGSFSSTRSSVLDEDRDTHTGKESR